MEIACRVYVEAIDADENNDETPVLTIFADVLQKIMKSTNVIALTEDEISEKLLELENIRLVFGNDNIVTECTSQV